MEKDNILQRLDKAFRYLDQVVPQPGRSVDMLAEARREYRLLWAEVAKAEPEEPLEKAETHEFRPVQPALKQQKYGDCHE